MFYKSPTPGGVLLRVAVVLMVFTTVLAGSFPSLPIGNTRVNAALPLAPPSNDNFANAQPILGASGIILGTNVGATKETSEPAHAGDAGGASVWYKWQAPNTGRFVFTTYKSKFDTLLAVYTGNSFTEPLKPIVSNDDAPRVPLLSSPFCFVDTSRVSFDFIGGVFYYIAVDRKSTAQSGDITLRWGRSATVSGYVSTAGGGSSLFEQLTEGPHLQGDDCRDSESGRNAYIFSDVPTGGTYEVTSPHAAGVTFKPWDSNPSISPLTGNVTNFNFYKDTPAANIKGKVTGVGGDTDLTVRCVSTPIPLVSQVAFFLGGGSYLCSGLPADSSYVITPTKPGFSFTPTSREARINASSPILDIFGIDFVGTALPPRTISGRVLDPSGTTGLKDVSVALSGYLTKTTITNMNGDYSFSDVLQGGNYTVTPSHGNFSFAPSNQIFNNLVTDPAANFTAVFLLQLILDDMGQVAALDSVFHTRDPFSLIDNTNLLNQGNTRVAVFVSGFQLGPGELPSSVEINLVGSNSQTYTILAEDVRLTSNPAFTQVIFKLPDGLTPGICTLFVKARGLTSNIGSMKIKV